MPSQAFQTLLRALQSEPDPEGPPDLAAERAAWAEYAQTYRPRTGVTDEPAGPLHDGSFLLTPDQPRDDTAILWIHGGVFRAGNAGADRIWMSWLAARTRCRAVLAEYRKAPENPYPAALEDCLAAFDYAASLAPRVIVAGLSAGANLAASVLLSRTGDPRAAAGVLLSGILDLRQERFGQGSWVERAESDPAIRSSAGWDQYVGTASPGDPLISPVLGTFGGLPPLFLQVSSAERLLDDSLELAAAAARAGVHVELEVWPLMTHGWQTEVDEIPEATEAMTRIAAFIGRVLDGRVRDGRVVGGR
jgi:epsilon-lactone hydrolase